MPDTVLTPWPEDEQGDDAASATEDPAGSAADPWERRRRSSPRGGPEFAELAAANRRFQDRLAAATPPPEVVAEVTRRLGELADVLVRHAADENARWDGWRPDLPGRGHHLLPPFIIDEEDTSSMRGRVTFGRVHLGGNGAVHGGAQPLLFDDLFGKVVSHHSGASVARTAYITVNYRAIAPIDEELHFEATVDKIEGRKRWASGRLFDADGRTIADAEGLFVQLRPGQP